MCTERVLRDESSVARVVSITRDQEFRELFSETDHPLVGMIHLPQLPGYHDDIPTDDEMNLLKANAIQDLEALHAAGFDAVMVENNGDNPRPYPENPMPDKAKDVYRMVMSEVVKRAKEYNMKIGVHIGYDPEAAIDIAHELKADFVRIDVFADSMIHDEQKIKIDATPRKFTEHNKKLEDKNKHRVFLLADVQVKHFTMVDTNKTLEQSVIDTMNAGADAIIVTGKWTGAEPNMDDVQLAKRVASKSNIPVLIGSGTTTDNCQKLLRVAYGIIVGTSIQAEGHRVDVDKARVLAETAKKS